MMKNLSNLDKQICAFEVMSQPLQDTLFDENFFDNLLDEMSIPKSPQTFVKGFEIQMSNLPIKTLRELSNKIRKRSNISENERKLLTNLATFLKQFQFAKTLKKYYDDKVYTSIYLLCFDPVEFVVPAFEDSHEELNDLDSFFLTEIESSIGLTELLKIDKKRKIVAITKDLFDLNIRWNKVLDEDNIDISALENETLVKLKIDNSRLNICKLIFFDLTLKTRIAVAMLKEWMNIFKKWWNENGGNMDNNELNNDIINRVSKIRKSVDKCHEDIKTLEHVILHIKRDGQSIESNENKLMEYITKKVDVVNLKDSVNKEYESLLARRTELIALLNYAIEGTIKYDNLSKEICNIEERINRKFMELKSLNYSVYLSQQDSDELVTSLKDFARWSDSSQQVLREKESEMQLKINEKMKSEALLEEVYQNIFRIKSIVGNKVGDFAELLDNNSSNSLRPYTSNTYTIDESNVRFKDMNMTESE